jgi:ketosteroid isomerase-like protein
MMMGILPIKILRVFMLVTAMLVAVPEVLAKAPSASAGESQKETISVIIRNQSKDWAQAILTKDASILERIWASDFIYVLPSAGRFNKTEGIADMINNTDQLTASVVSSIDVRVYGGGTVAVDIGDWKRVGHDKDGKPFEWNTRFTNVWVLNEGHWQCVNGQASNIPVAP